MSHERSNTVAIIVHKVTIVSRTIDVPTTCPNCEADLTQTGSIEEGRLCSTVATSHLNAASADDALNETDTQDEDADYRATVFVNCAECGHHIVEE